MFDLLAFDADDTLWHNEPLYIETKEKFQKLLSSYHDPQWVAERLDEAEVRNLEHYGFGIKAFMLSMIETAIELSEGRVTGADIQQILDYGRAMLNYQPRLLEGVAETLRRLAKRYPLMVITKGDLLDQETKLARSGLAESVTHFEVVSQKTVETYQAILKRHQVRAERFLMVGNALKSDILPVIATGGYGVYIPYENTWAIENVSDPQLDRRRFFEIARISELPALLERLEGETTESS